MQALFRDVLKDEFERLAPAIQRHYDVQPNQTVWVRGQMDCWNKFEWARVFLPFSPKNAAAVPVVVRNRMLQNSAGEWGFEWHREFHYASGQQLSYTFTRHTLNHTPSGVLDLFNQPPNIGVELVLSVSADGRTLTQESTGVQYAVLGNRFIKLPSLFSLHTLATERALDDTHIQTDVVIRHALFGKLFGYSGVLQVAAA